MKPSVMLSALKCFVQTSIVNVGDRYSLPPPPESDFRVRLREESLNQLSDVFCVTDSAGRPQDQNFLVVHPNANLLISPELENHIFKRQEDSSKVFQTLGTILNLPKYFTLLYYSNLLLCISDDCKARAVSGVENECESLNKLHVLWKKNATFDYSPLEKNLPSESIENVRIIFQKFRDSHTFPSNKSEQQFKKLCSAFRENSNLEEALDSLASFVDSYDF